MDWKGVLFRFLVAAIAVALFFTLLPLLFQILELPVSGALMKLIKVCIAGLALLYVLTG